MWGILIRWIFLEPLRGRLNIVCCPVTSVSTETDVPEQGKFILKICDQNHSCLIKSIFRARNKKFHKQALFKGPSEIIFENAEKFPDRCLGIFTMKRDPGGAFPRSGGGISILVHAIRVF